MDTSVRTCEKKPNPVKKANVLSTLTFSYMLPIFKRSFKKGLKQEDLFEPLDEHKSSNLGEQLEKIWLEEKKKYKRIALHVALLKMFGLQLAILGVLKLIDELVLLIIMPIAVGKIVSYFERNQNRISNEEAYIYIALLIGGLLMDAVLAHPSMMGLMHISMKLRVSCSSLIYRKTLRLTRTALGKTTVGQVVNLLSNDVSKFDQGFVLCHFVWIAPIVTALGTYLLYREIGISAFFGMAFLLCFIPLQIWMGKKAAVLRLKTALRTDERVRLMNEIISGIQVIKMYTWEKPFAKLIAWARKKEINAIRSHSYLYGIIVSFESFITRTSIFISILGYVLLGETMSAEKIFAVTAIYNQVRPNATFFFSISITALADVNISILRLQQFLSYEELPAVEYQRNVPVLNGAEKKPLHNSKPHILLKDVSAKWIECHPENTLDKINLDISENVLVAIVGPVGSGKTSLFNVILKELPIQSGSMEVAGEVSYSCQEPWLFIGSIRQNILFGNDFDEERYKAVVKVCALESDFDMFPYGDRTVIGEKGKTLSGGQKARVNLARCIYKQADIYLLDDPLSAVDANVGKQLYEECIKKFLSDKICVLITHQLQYLKSADKIIVMKEGEIEIEGKYSELQTSGVDFAKLLEKLQDDEEAEKKKVKSRQNSEMVDKSEDEEEEPEVEKETMDTGSIKYSVYKNYVRAGGNAFMIMILVLSFLLCQIFTNGGDYYVSYWVNLEQKLSEQKANNLTGPNETLPRDEIIYVYSGLILGTIFFALFHTIYFFIFFMMASINLHNHTFSKIIKGTMRFYNKNPTGRILNRFSKDMGIVDEYIPSVLFDVLEIALLLLGTIVLTCIVNPWLVPASLGLILLFYFLRIVYLKTSRSVKRIEGITRSPIFGHMTASMHGLSTIRSFKKQDVLIEEFDRYQDNHSAAWYLFIASNRAFGFWLDILCIAFIGCVIFSLFAFDESLYGGDMGLVITQYFGLIGTLQWGMRQWSELENQMTSVERILEYTRVESEPERDKSNKPLTKDWPEKGKIEFRDVSMKYSPDEPYVLRNLNIVIQPKEKIGVVGRTGAGKSSTIAALFQLYEIEGKILIDDVDTTQLPLDEVRSKISIIPQEPVLFSGTMRKNLDPFDEYNDEILWNALRQVELKDVISDLPSGLNTNVTEGGSNFSVGQRQLVCLARAIVRNNRILVLDEATANVDPHTDVLIQKTIRENFANCTVLTIAHRLHTVMDSDKILVMDAGSAVEFDHPYNLLQKEDSLFAKLVQTTGKNTANTLQSIANKNFQEKKKQ